MHDALRRRWIEGRIVAGFHRHRLPPPPGIVATEPADVVVTLTTSEEVDVGYLAPVDAAGHPAPVEPGSVVWRTSDAAVATVTPVQDDPIVGTIVAQGPGTCEVWADVDADLGAGVSTVTGDQVHIEVIAGAVVDLGDPVVSPPRDQGGTGPTPPPSRLVQPHDLIYQGAFRVPPNVGYAGAGLTFDAEHNALWLCDAASNYIAEISIIDPVISVGGIPSDLPRATLRQPLTDACCGLLAGISGESGGSVNVGGLLVWKGKLIVAAHRYYDGNGDGVMSHIVASRNLSAPAATGPYPVGAYGAGCIGGYMGEVPPPWQAALGGPVVGGLCGVPIVTRTSVGPTGFSFNPDHIDTIKPHAPTIPLAYYANPRGPLCFDYVTCPQSDLFTRVSRVRGVVVCPSGTETVLFFGDTGLGPNCYGSGEDCGDPYNNSKGDHAPPYEAYVWAYDAHDLAAVKAGTIACSAVAPYAYWIMHWPFASWGQTTSMGGAYDQATGRMWVAQLRGGSEESVIHCYTIRTVR